MTDETTTPDFTADESTFDSTMNDLWNESGRTRRRREADERDDTTAESIADALIATAGGSTGAEIEEADRLGSMIREAQVLGLTSEEMETLRTMPIQSAEAQAVFDRATDILLNAAARGKQGLQSMFDKKLNAILRGEEVEDGVEAEDQTFDDGNAVEYETEGEQEDGGEEDAEEAYTAETFLQAVMNAGSDEERLDLIQRLAAGTQVDNSPSEELERLRMENQVLALAVTHPKASQILKQLTDAPTLQEQAELIERLATGQQAPVPEVDRNNRPRPLTPGIESALAGAEMTEELADILIANAPKGSWSEMQRKGF